MTLAAVVTVIWLESEFNKTDQITAQQLAFITAYKSRKIDKNHPADNKRILGYIIIISL